nr:PASTA domain-containing protein [Kineosporia babensis]
MLVFAVIGVASGCSDVPGADEPPASMPKVVGLVFDEAQDRLDDLDLRGEDIDASTLDRSVWDRGNWTVIDQVPAAGEQVSESDEIMLYVLKNSEAQWFAKHAEMPKVEGKVQSASDLTRDGGSFAGVDELVEFYYAKGRQPAYLRGQKPRQADPSPVPALLPNAPKAMAKRHAQLKPPALHEAAGDDPVAGTWPRAGATLVPGQGLYILTKEVPTGISALDEPEPQAAAEPETKSKAAPTADPEPKPVKTREERKPQQENSSCDPNYTGACVPIASDVDCAGGSGDGPAYLSEPAEIVGSDIYDLDADGDGWGCEPW